MEYDRYGFKRVIVNLQHACSDLKVLVMHRDPLYFNAIEIVLEKLKGMDPIAFFCHTLARL